MPAIRPILSILLIWTVAHGGLGGAAERPAVVFDFESGDLQGWRIAEGETYVALCTDDGTQVLHARGKNTEVFQPVSWDAGKLVGRRVYLKAVDLFPGVWGYIGLDDVQAEGRLDARATEARIALRKGEGAVQAGLGPPPHGRLANGDRRNAVNGMAGPHPIATCRSENLARFRVSLTNVLP
jgi:hypothetical protein